MGLEALYLTEAYQLGNIGIILRNKSDLDNAIKYLEESLKIDREIGYKPGQAPYL